MDEQKLLTVLKEYYTGSININQVLNKLHIELNELMEILNKRNLPPIIKDEDRNFILRKIDDILVKKRNRLY